MWPSGGSWENSGDQIAGAAERSQGKPATQRLGQHDQVGSSGEMFEREKFPGAAETGQNFVENQQRTSQIAALAQGPHKPRARNADSAFGLNRFYNDGGDSRIDRLERGDIIIWKMANRAGQRRKRLAKCRIAHQRECRHGIAVIGAVERDEARASSVLLRECECGLDRLGATVGEIYARQIEARNTRPGASPASPATR